MAGCIVRDHCEGFPDSILVCPGSQQLTVLRQGQRRTCDVGRLGGDDCGRRIHDNHELLRFGGKVGDRERLWREHEAGQNVDLVTHDQLLRKPLCGIRRASGILADERDLTARNRIAVLLHVQLDAVVHLRGRVRKLAREAHQQTDLQHLLRMRDTNAVAEQQKAETQSCLSHCFLPSSAQHRSHCVLTIPQATACCADQQWVMGGCPLCTGYYRRTFRQKLAYLTDEL